MLFTETAQAPGKVWVAHIRVSNSTDKSFYLLLNLFCGDCCHWGYMCFDIIFVVDFILRPLLRHIGVICLSRAKYELSCPYQRVSNSTDKSFYLLLSLFWGDCCHWGYMCFDIIFVVDFILRPLLRHIGVICLSRAKYELSCPYQRVANSTDHHQIPIQGFLMLLFFTTKMMIAWFI